MVESDESTANFDPEFTSADVYEVGGDAVKDLEELDEEDPSEDWLQSASASGQHTPNGPLGSDRLWPLSPMTPSGGEHGRTTSPSTAQVLTASKLPQTPGIQINTKSKRKEANGTPLTSSVQENFRGFTFSGGESVVTPNGIMSARSAFRESVQSQSEADAEEATSESEFDDGEGAPLGRFSKRRGTDMDA